MKFTLPVMDSKVEEKGKKSGLKGNMLSTTSLGAPIASAHVSSHGSGSTKSWVDRATVATVEVNYAPRGSLNFLGVPFQSLSRPVIATAAVATCIELSDLDGPKPSALKRMKVAAPNKPVCVDLTGEDSDD
jgi:hypothetical protein